MDAPSLLLGSASPRRRRLLEAVGIPVGRVVSPRVDESFAEGAGQAPSRIVQQLARRKADWVAHYARPTPREVLLTADTIVVLDGTILGKPASPQEAIRMLQRLRGRTHQVFTAVEMRWADGGTAFVDRAAVTFGDVSDDDIARYVASGAPLDKAGAYGAQDWMGLVAVRRIEGSFYTVMGLPVDRVYAVWRRLTVAPPNAPTEWDPLSES